MNDDKISNNFAMIGPCWILFNHLISARLVLAEGPENRECGEIPQRAQRCKVDRAAFTTDVPHPSTFASLATASAADLPYWAAPITATPASTAPSAPFKTCGRRHAPRASASAGSAFSMQQTSAAFCTCRTASCP